MSDQPQENILGRGLDNTGRIPARKTSTDDPQKKRSSVYIYLVVLFGAAFLMLLLAYFVQQRNSESTISDLRDSMNLSRKELLDEVDLLKEENEALQQVNGELRDLLAGLEEDFDQSKVQAQTLAQRLQETSNQLTSWNSFWSMETAFRDKDYDTCAGCFQNEFASETFTAPADAKERIEEIYQELVDLGYLSEGDSLSR